MALLGLSTGHCGAQSIPVHLYQNLRMWDAMDSRRADWRTMQCPRCKEEIKRKEIRGGKSRPVWISFERPDGTRGEKPASVGDIASALQFTRKDVSTWFPEVP